MAETHDPYKAPKSDFEEVPKSTHYVMDGPQGLVGFLLLPLFGMFVTVIYSFYVLLKVFSPMIGSDLWHRISGGGVLFQTINLLNIGFLTFSVLFNLILLWCFFRKLRVFPKLIQCWYVAAVLYHWLFLILVVIVRESYPGVFVDGNYATLAFQISVSAIIWISYFRVSKRVKNTFQY